MPGCFNIKGKESHAIMKVTRTVCFFFVNAFLRTLKSNEEQEILFGYAIIVIRKIVFIQQLKKLFSFNNFAMTACM